MSQGSHHQILSGRHRSGIGADRDPVRPRRRSCVAADSDPRRHRRCRDHSGGRPFAILSAARLETVVAEQLIALCFGAVVLFILFGGTLWIMFNLNYRKM